MELSNSKIILSTVQINAKCPVKFEFQLMDEKLFSVSMSQILLESYSNLTESPLLIFLNAAALFHRLTLISAFLSLRPRLLLPSFCSNLWVK